MKRKKAQVLFTNRGYQPFFSSVENQMHIQVLLLIAFFLESLLELNKFLNLKVIMLQVLFEHLVSLRQIRLLGHTKQTDMAFEW